MPLQRANQFARSGLGEDMRAHRQLWTPGGSNVTISQAPTTSNVYAASSMLSGKP